VATTSVSWVLPIAPRPHADELISSWLGRVAAYYNLSGQDLLREIVGRIDERIDHRMPSDARAKIAAATRVPEEAIKNHDIAAVYPRLGQQWLPSIVQFEPDKNACRKIRPITPSWCAHCLAERRLAYGSAYLDFTCVLPLAFCHRHGILRWQGCQSCKSIMTPTYDHSHRGVDLVCSACFEHLEFQCKFPVRGVHRESDVFSDVTKTLDLVRAFELQLITSLLHGPIWTHETGHANGTQFGAFIADMTNALMLTMAVCKSPISEFETDAFAYIGNVYAYGSRHCSYAALTPFRRAHVLAAILSMISNDKVRIQLTVPRAWRRYTAWTAPKDFRWLYSQHNAPMQRAMREGIGRWPPKLRDLAREAMGG
jgi:TniQ